MPGQRGELLDARLHVVPGDPLTFGDRGQVDRRHALVHDLLVGLDRAGRDGHAQVGLRTQHRQPQLALQHDLV